MHASPDLYISVLHASSEILLRSYTAKTSRGILRIPKIIPMYLLHLFLGQLILLGIIHGGTAVHCGYPAEEGQFKYVVGIRQLIPISANVSEMNFCGGAIIDETRILTAAHCLAFTRTFDNVDIIAGVADYKSPTAVRRKVTAMTRHPKFKDMHWVPAREHARRGLSDRIPLTNDIAVITLDAPLVLEGNIAKIDLPPEDFTPGCAECRFAGWGYNYYSQTNANLHRLDSKLRWTTFAVMTPEQCASTPRPGNQLCVIDMGPRQTCVREGDSGGPLVCNNVVIGIASYSRQGGTQVFTKVQEHLEFINCVLEGRCYEPDASDEEDNERSEYVDMSELLG